MKVTFSKDDNKEIKVLPYVTDDAVEINYGDAELEQFSSFKHGNIVVKGAKPLTTITISGVFPNGTQSWMETEAEKNPMVYRNFFRDALKNGTILRVMMQRKGQTIALLNINCIVTSFVMQTPKRNGDIPYNLTVSQYVKLSTKR